MAFGKEGVRRCAGRCAHACVRPFGAGIDRRARQKSGAHTAERHRTAAVWNDQAAARRTHSRRVRERSFPNTEGRRENGKPNGRKTVQNDEERDFD